MNKIAQPQANLRRDLSQICVGVVMPLLNEEAILRSLIQQIQNELTALGCHWQIVLVNDGSTDRSGEILDELAQRDNRIRVVHLSRNFGHQAATHAGLSHCDADAVILMDSDGQDAPIAIPKMVQQWQAGFDVVYAVREKRKESAWKRLAFTSFYRLLNSVAVIDIPRDAGNFGLLDRRVVNQVSQLPESDRYFPGLRRWVGFRQTSVVVERLARHDDQPRVSFRGLIALAKTALFGFSRVPLTAFYALAVLSAALCVACVGWTLFHKCFTGMAIPGWTSITIVSAFFGSINSLGIAILGEYVCRIYDQVRQRPQFIIDRAINLQATQSASPTAKFNSHLTSDVAAFADQELETALLQDIRALQEPTTMSATRIPVVEK